MQSTTISDVRTIAVPVTDQDAAADFYVGVLGFERRLDAPISPTMRWLEVAPPGAGVSLALEARQEDDDRSSDTGIRFTVPDAAAEHEALQSRGVAVSDLLRWEGVPPMFTFADPDGNRFYVVEDLR